MGIRERVLRRGLKRAKRLLEARELTPAEYGLICVNVVDRLRQLRKDPDRPPGPRPDGDWVDFTVRAMSELSRGGHKWPPTGPEQTLAIYGPYNEAVHDVQAELIRRQSPDAQEHGFRWGPDAVDLLRQANVRFSRVGRASLHLEQWLADYARSFPHLSSAIAKIAIAVFSGLIGYLLGRR